MTTLPFPVDRRTGIPHLIWTGDYSQTGKMNYDHCFFHERAEQLRNSSGRVVRWSMGQVMPISTHQIKNVRFSHLERLPETNEKKHRTTVFALTGLVSRMAVDLTKRDDDLLFPMDDDQLAFLTDASRLHWEKALKDEKTAAYRKNDIGKFFVYHALRHRKLRRIISPELEQEYIHAELGGSTELETGSLIIRAAIEASVSGLEAECTELRASGSVFDNGSTPLQVVRAFADENKFPDYFPVLNNFLAPIEQAKQAA